MFSPNEQCLCPKSKAMLGPEEKKLIKKLLVQQFPCQSKRILVLCVDPSTS